MPTLRAAQLEALTRRVLAATGAPEDEAGIVAEGLVAANLAGHDSHGVIQPPTCVDRIRRGDIVPGAPIEIERETETTAQVNGHWGFGFVVTRRATDLAIGKAQRHNVAAVSIYRT